MAVDKRSIFLVGLMGAGKTTVGKMLATRTGMSFVDTDHQVEARNGVSIPTIFEIEGEEGFRRREALLVKELAVPTGVVLATGGGAVLRTENREVLRENGWVVYLRVAPHDLFERTKHDKSRPLLQTSNPLGKLTELFSIRDPLYQEVAHCIVEGGRMGTSAVVNYILREYEKQCAR